MMLLLCYGAFGSCKQCGKCFSESDFSLYFCCNDFMAKQIDIGDRISRRLWVLLSFIVLVLIFLSAAYLYSELPNLTGPNAGEGAIVLLALIVMLILPLNAVALIFSPNKSDQLIPWVGTLLLIWGAPITSAYYWFPENLRTKVQCVEAILALCLAAYSLYRGGIAFVTDYEREPKESA
ncbi:MAG: hypothetical protein IPG59_09275 [Candidatus Melainabacteria bacterium]|nr:MAG: hypothetical protein IPG59_09275 [Candidatus Melainabacteria bacterium]